MFLLFVGLSFYNPFVTSDVLLFWKDINKSVNSDGDYRKYEVCKFLQNDLNGLVVISFLLMCLVKPWPASFRRM